MSLFNASSPADTDSVKPGAGQIRSLKGTLNSLLSQVFADDLTFKPGFVVNSLLSGSSSDDSLRSVGSNNLKNGAAILRTLPDGVFTADAPGRAKFASGFVTSALLASTITLPDGSVTAAAIATGAVGTDELAALAATIAKVGAGVAKIAVGTFTGSNTLAATVNTLGFVPTVLMLTGGRSSNRVGVAFKAESLAGTSPIHSLWDSGNVLSPFTTAIVWATNGFTITPANNTFNDGGITHTYLALAV